MEKLEEGEIRRAFWTVRHHLSLRMGSSIRANENTLGGSVFPAIGHVASTTLEKFEIFSRALLSRDKLRNFA